MCQTLMLPDQAFAHTACILMRSVVEKEDGLPYQHDSDYLHLNCSTDKQQLCCPEMINKAAQAHQCCSLDLPPVETSGVTEAGSCTLDKWGAAICDLSG